jgi:uncharacterized membrane protein YbhN (UPF0104 family)
LKLPVKQLAVALCVVGSIYGLVLWAGGKSQSFNLLNVLLTPEGALALILCLLNFVLRGLRWRIWMRHFQRPLRLVQSLRFYLAGYTFTPTPGNVGEALRAVLIARQPLNLAQSLAIFGAERLADLLCLLLLCLPGAWWLIRSTPFDLSMGSWTLGAILVILVAGVAVIWLVPYLLKRFSWLKEAFQCLTSKPWNWFGLTFFAWLLQGLAVWLLYNASGLTVQWWEATGFYALAMVGGAVSMLPAGLGGTEAILSGLWLAYGIELAVATGITILIRLVTLWLAVGIGAIALIYSAVVAKDIQLSSTE